MLERSNVHLKLCCKIWKYFLGINEKNLLLYRMHCIIPVFGERFRESSSFLPFSTKCLVHLNSPASIYFVVFFQSDVAQYRSSRLAHLSVKKFVKTVYQQFFVGTTFQTQNGLVWRIYRSSHSMRQNVKISLCSCNIR